MRSSNKRLLHAGALDWEKVQETGTLYLAVPDRHIIDPIAGINMPAPGVLVASPNGRAINVNGSQNSFAELSVPTNPAGLVIAGRIRATAVQQQAVSAAFVLCQGAGAAERAFGIGVTDDYKIGAFHASSNGITLRANSQGVKDQWYTIYAEIYANHAGTIAFIDGTPAQIASSIIGGALVNSVTHASIGAGQRSARAYANFNGEIEWGAIFRPPPGPGGSAGSLTPELAAQLYADNYPYNLFREERRKVWAVEAVSGGGSELKPPLLTNTSALYAPAIARGAVTVSPGLIESTTVLFVPTIARGAVSLAAPLLTNSAVLFAPIVSTGGHDIQPPLLTNISTLFAPVVAAGTVSVLPPLLTNISTLYAPVLSAGGFVLQPPLLTNIAALYAPAVVRGTVPLAAPLLTNTSTLFAPLVTQPAFAQALAPPLLINSSVLFAPAVGDILPLTPAEMRDLYARVIDIHAQLSRIRADTRLIPALL